MAHHHHGSAHGLDARRTDNRRRMLVALAINVAMLALGIVGGLITGSLAVLADAGHVLSDVGSIALALLAVTMARRPANNRRTFGLQRGEVLAALVNGLALAAISVLIVVAAIGRLSDPPDVKGAGVILIGALGLLGNVAAAWVLARGDRVDLNLEGVLRHAVADALGSLAVVVSGLAVLAFGWLAADPIASILVAVLVAASSVRLVMEPFDVLMESAPGRLDLGELGEALCAVEGVRAVHELHAWTVTSGFETLSAHVVVEADHDRDAVRRELEFILAKRFALEHTTLQMEEEVDSSRLLQLDRPADA